MSDSLESMDESGESRVDKNPADCALAADANTGRLSWAEVRDMKERACLSMRWMSKQVERTFLNTFKSILVARKLEDTIANPSMLSRISGGGGLKAVSELSRVSCGGIFHYRDICRQCQGSNLERRLCQQNRRRSDDGKGNK
ncbi:hypothetical protein PM082_010028 [Marasmius tenuissimus]|nr:hypothetical protein PM082_010028 [Marasmius tenuissimus]